jgi:hypothetical protein
MQGYQQPGHLGIDMQKPNHISATEKSVMKKITLRLSRFIDWLARGNVGKSPCVG